MRRKTSRAQAVSGVTALPDNPRCSATAVRGTCPLIQRRLGSKRDPHSVEHHTTLTADGAESLNHFCLYPRVIRAIGGEKSGAGKSSRRNENLERCESTIESNQTTDFTGTGRGRTGILPISDCPRIASCKKSTSFSKPKPSRCRALRFLLYGAHGYMIKPVQFGELEKLIRTIADYWRVSCVPPLPPAHLVQAPPPSSGRQN